MGCMAKKKVHCDVENLLRLIAGRWKVLILRELDSGPLRHGQLRRHLEGISQKILTQRLRELETSGLLLRHDFLDGRLKVVEYSLTEWGCQVKQFVDQLHNWAILHHKQLSPQPNEYHPELNQTPR